jgi:hypothetical protein
VRKRRGEWIYAYTAMYNPPARGTGYVDYLTACEPRSLNAQNSLLEIRVANFYNIIQYNKKQKENWLGRKFSVKSLGKYRKVGRHPKRRKTH